jgi:preprotein translocase subunit SecE
VTPLGGSLGYMNSKVETQGSKADTAKLVVALVLVVAGAIAFNYFSDQALLIRVGGVIVVMAVALGVMMSTAYGRNAVLFVKDARTEVRKVVWPTWPETRQTTLVVIIMVIVVGLLLWVIDSFLLWAVKWLTGQGG